MLSRYYQLGVLQLAGPVQALAQGLRPPAVEMRRPPAVILLLQQRKQNRQRIPQQPRDGGFFSVDP